MKNVTGPRIRELRRLKMPRMTQADLANSLQLKGIKIDRAGIAKIEGGYRRVSDVELVTIARALEVPAGDLLDGSEDRLSETRSGQSLKRDS